MIKLVIFDLDGTLVNSIEDLADSVNLALSQNGYAQHPVDSYRKFVGNGTVKLIERALPQGTDKAEQERIHAVFSEIYRSNCLNKTKPYEGILSLLSFLKQKGIKCAVASNKPDAFSKQIVHTLFGESVFDFVCGKASGCRSKPAPDIVYNIMRELGFSAHETIMIGDSDVDVITAHNAGIRCIGCEWGFRGREELTEAGAEYIVSTPQEIADICL